MPPKKKAKKTQTVSLDKRAQAKLLRGRASAFEAEETAEETPKKGVSEKFKKKVLEHENIFDPENENSFRECSWFNVSVGEKARGTKRIFRLRSYRKSRCFGRL